MKFNQLHGGELFSPTYLRNLQVCVEPENPFIHMSEKYGII
jgi:hypothetical protein